MIWRTKAIFIFNAVKKKGFAMGESDAKAILKRLLGILKKKKDMPEDERFEIINYCHELVCQ